MADRNYEQILKELALDLHWSWSHMTDEIWKTLDPVLWDLTHNPLVIVNTVSLAKINELLGDEAVRQKIDEFVEAREQVLQAPAWFQQFHTGRSLSCVAYFSMEFMLSEALPIYSGGLGNVAGDHLKSASDLGIPIIGIGLLYQQGYVHQVIDKEGNQLNYFPYNDPGQLPVTPLRTATGEWLRIEVHLPGYSLWLRTWQVQVGRVTLLLLDSNDSANFPAHRGITSELYGAGSELRLMQEMVLGMGGWRLLKALNKDPEVCHLNEGHAAFVVLERAADFMQQNDQSFEVALAITRSGNLFTTHTAIGAGFDTFRPELIQQYLGKYAADRLRISIQELLALGRANSEDANEGFNMAYLGIRGSMQINGVSRLHGKVSRQLFSSLFPRWPIDEVPIEHVTNGVHMPTWDSTQADQLWTEACGKDRWRGNIENWEEKIRSIPLERIWAMHTANHETFINYIRKRYSRQLAMIGMPLKNIEDAHHLWNPDVLTLGFARRFVPYKRTNLLLHHPERLYALLTNKQRPVQLILAGKAHPDDPAGQQMIREWFAFIQKWNLQEQVIFLSDYDMVLTEHMVQGVDLWVNTPRRPWEACGTSGMKVLVNGGINLSVLDGWWDEAYNPQVGWALGGGDIVPAPDVQDALDAAQLYDLLEKEIIPEFYNRNAQGIPEQWVMRMRESMAQLTPQYSANRSVREYAEKYYLPAAATYRQRAVNKGEKGIQLVHWKRSLENRWHGLHFGKLAVVREGEKWVFSVEIFPGELLPSEIIVELYADGINEKPAEKYDMHAIPGKSVHPILYTIDIPAFRHSSDYTPRIYPNNNELIKPLECGCILWQQ